MIDNKHHLLLTFGLDQLHSNDFFNNLITECASKTITISLLGGIRYLNLTYAWHEMWLRRSLNLLFKRHMKFFFSYIRI